MLKDVEIKEKWIVALRSGKFPQGNSVLKKHHFETGTFRFCCLGVLCDVVDPTKWQRDAEINYSSIYKFDDLYEKDNTSYSWQDSQSTTQLPYHMMDELGLTRDQCTRLMEMNDAEDKNFNEIADWIEANL